MKPNPLPLENCSPEESIQYLETHIANLNEMMQEMDSRYEDADKDAQTRAWAMDRAVRLYEGKPVPDKKLLTDTADLIYQYIQIRKETVQ